MNLSTVSISMSNQLLTTIDYDTLDTDFNSTLNDTSVAGERNEALAKLEIATLAAIFVSILIGNVPIVVTIIFGRLMRTRMYYFLIHLCIADLITGFFNVVPQLAWEITHHFHGGNILCKAVKYLQILGPYLSSYILVAMSIDRFQAICYPLSNNHLSLYRAKRSIALAWGFSLLFCAPQVFIFSYQVIADDFMECWATFPLQPWGERAYVTWYAVSVFIIPFFAISYTNVCICWELWRASRSRRSRRAERLKCDKLRKQSSPTEVNKVDTVSGHGVERERVKGLERPVFTGKAIDVEDEEQKRAKIKSVKLTVTVILCYIVCSLPFICVQLWAYYYPGAQSSDSWSGN